MILYKYRQCSENTQSIFTGQKVWLAKASTLNDPCECSIHDLSPEWVTEQVREMKRAQMSGVLLPSQPLPAALLNEIKATLPLIEDLDAKYEAFRKLRDASAPEALAPRSHLFTAR